MSSVKSTSASSTRACKFCRGRKMKCSGDRPWCTNCKEKNRPCIYDNGAVGVRKREAGTQLAVKRTIATISFPSSSGDETLWDELDYVFCFHWSGDIGVSRSRVIEPSPGRQQQVAAIDFQRGLSQIFTMTVDSLVVESLPFGQRLQVYLPASSHLLSDQVLSHADKFYHYSPKQARPFADDELLRHPQIYELAFNSHPFVALIVCRTIFLGDVEERACDKVFYDSILLAGLGAKEALAHSKPDFQTEPYGLPDTDELVQRTCRSLYASKVASLMATSLHTHVQCMMILAWHELTHGLVRRAATWWTVICGMIQRIRALRDHEEARAECHVNGVDMSLIVAEELKNMETITHLVLLWLELSLGPVLAQTTPALYPSPRQSTENSTSWILELDDKSGKVSNKEAFQRSSALLRSIERVLESLKQRFDECKASSGFVEMRILPATECHDTTRKVNAILSRARRLQSCSASTSSIEPSAAALISMTALLACFESRYAPISMSEENVLNIVKVCSAITLQLREAFGDWERHTIPAARNFSADSTRSSTTELSYFTDTMDGGRIVLTMIETIALTFEILLSDMDSDRGDEASNTLELVLWSHEAQESVAEKLGNILGILSTIKECFDNIPKQGGRPSHVLHLLDRLKERLEKFEVQPDVSFAFDVAFAPEELESAPPEGPAVKGEAIPPFNPYEMVPLHCSPTNKTASSSVEEAERASKAPSNSNPIPHYGGLDAAYPTPPIEHRSLNPPLKGVIAYGPGPIALGRQDRSEAASSYFHGNALGSSLRLAYQDQGAPWRGGSQIEALGMLALTTQRFESVHPVSDGGAFKALIPMPSVEDIIERMQPYVDDAGNLRATPAWSHGRAGAIQPGTQLLYPPSDVRTSPRMAAMHQHHVWNYQEPVYLSAIGTRSDLQVLNNERDAKRIRIDSGLGWIPRKETRQGGQRSMDERSSNQSGLHFGQGMMASTFREPYPMPGYVHGSHLHAAEALASIQSIEPLTDANYSSSDWEKGKGKGKRRTSPKSITSATTDTSVSSLAADDVDDVDDDDDEYVDDNGGYDSD